MCFANTANSGAVAMYLNGDYEAPTDPNYGGHLCNNPISNTSTILLGTSGGQYFTGLMDGVGVYNRTLTATEIKQLYYSNLNKYNSTDWTFYTNESNLSQGTYTYSASAKDSLGNENVTEIRTISIDTHAPNATLISPTNNTYTTFATSATATGGNITYDGLYTIHTFISNGTFNVSGGSLNAEVLVVAGGGAGSGEMGGGGGGGGVIYNSSYAIAAGSYTITVGTGGIGGSGYGVGQNGSNSVFGALIAYGGSKGWNGWTSPAPGGGGSGGGGCAYNGYLGGSGVTGQGFAGGNGGGGDPDHYAGGGGGGAGGVGGNGSWSGGVLYGGNGGLGFVSNISGSSQTYSSGGGGCALHLATFDPMTGGYGGVGAGNGAYQWRETNFTAASDATYYGCGGGSRGWDNDPVKAGNGYQGIIIVRYLTQQPVTLNFTANISDNLGIQNATLYVYNSTGLFNSTTTNYAADVIQTTLGIVVTLVDNVYNWFYSIFDWAGNNFQTGNYTVTVDTINPNINLTYPQNTTYNTIITSMNYTVSDTRELPYIYYNSQKLYISPTDNSALIMWGGYGNVTGAQSDTNGSNNTATIVSVLGAGTYAAKLCSDLSFGGYDDWYLPAKTQLLNMSVQRNNVTKEDYAAQWVDFEADVYWSSAELPGDPGNIACGVNLVVGDVGCYYKNWEFNARCVRDYTPVAYSGSCWYYNGTANNTIPCGTNITTKLYSNQGSNTWIVYANDSAGNENSSSVTFFVDSINPTINFTNMTEVSGSYIARANIKINVTATDTNFKNLTIRVYNSSRNLINSTNATLATLFSNFTGLSDGIYYFNATACDILNNCNNTETRSVTTDTTKPLIDYGAGTLASGVNVSQSNIYVNVSVTETNEANVTFRLYNSTSQVNATTLAAGTRNVNWIGLADGEYNYNVTITDLANNQNTTLTRTITLDVHAPNATLISPANNTYTNNTSQNFTANLSDNLGIQDSTLYIYNSTGLFNSTTTNYAADVTATTLGIVVSLVDNVYTWFVNLFDFAGNQYATANNTLTIDTVYPQINFTNPTPSSGTSQNSQSFLVNITATDANPIYSLVNFDNSLISWWRLESGNGTFFADDIGKNNGTCFGAQCPTFTNMGKFGGAYSFDAVNNFISAGTAASLNFTSASNYTFSSWIKINGVGSDGAGNTILGKRNSSGAGYKFYVYNDSRGLYFQSDNTNITSNYPLNSNTWYHVAYTKNSSGEYLFVNGVEVANGTSPTLSTSTSNLYIGSYIITGLGLFNGNIDEVLAFNRSLSSNEIKSLYDATANRYQNNFTNLGDGTHTFKSYTIDATGFKNSTETRNATIDTINPAINFTSPTDTTGSYFSRTNIVINTTASDSDLVNITIKLFNSTQTLINSTTSLTSPDFVNITSLSDGIYFFNATAADRAGNRNNTETRNITIDTTKPLVEFNNGTQASASSPNIYVNITVTETNEANVTFKLYNSTSQVNATTLSAGTRSINWTGLADGTYTYNVTVTDLALNANTTETRTITLDKTAPNGTLILPANGTYANASSQNFTANLTDNLGIQNSTLFIYNSTGLYNSTIMNYSIGVTQTTLGIVVTLVDNVYTWFVNIFDWAGNNIQTANNTLTIDTIYPAINFTNPTTSSGTSQNTKSIFVNISATDANPIYSLVNLDNSLVGWWRMEQGNGMRFTDDTGSNNGTCFGAQCPTFTKLGKFGGAYNFDAVNNFISVGLPTVLNFASDSNYTFSSWIKMNGVGYGGAANPILGKYSSGAGYLFYVYNDSRGLYFQSDNSNLTSNYQLNFSTWYHVAYTKNSSNQYLFVNGVEIANGTSPTLSTSAATFYIGTDTNPPTSLFNGTIDEVLAFNRSLSSNEIKSLYDANINKYQNNFTNLGDGTHTFKSYIVDATGFKNSTETRNVTIDTINPAINFTSPTDTTGSYFGRTNIVINTTASDADLVNITIKLFNSTTLINSTTSLSSPNFVNITSLTDGIYFFNATAADRAGNRNNTSTRNITIDTTKPLVDYGAGTLATGVNVSQSNIYVNVTVTETNEANVTFRLYNSTSQVNATTLSAGTRSINWTSLPDKTYTYNATITDLANNQNTTVTRTITLDVHAPNATLISPANNTYVNVSSQNFTANLTDNLGIQNSTLFIYNSTGLYNSTVTTFAANITQTTLGIVVNLLDNVYSWFYQLFDWAGNNIQTANNTLTIDTRAPSVFSLKPVANTNFNISSIIEISANVTDTNAISSVRANITKSDSTSEIITLTNAGGSKYNSSFTAPNMIGRFNVSIIANDSARNINNSEATYFIVRDNILPGNDFAYPTPENGSIKGTNTTSFKLDISDNIAVDSCILNLDGTNYTMAKNGANCNLTKTNIADGWHNFTAFVNDSSGNINQTETRTYKVDISSPDVEYVDPTETSGAYLVRSNILINVSVNPGGVVLSNITVRLYNSVRVLINQTTTTSSPNFVNITGLANGIYYFNATAVNNASGAGYTETRTVTLDTINPSINFTSPTEANNLYLDRNYILANVTANDTNLRNITISLFNSTRTLINSSITLTSPDYVNFSGLSDGIYYLNATSYDSALNKNSTETRTITLDTTKPLVDYGTGTLASGVNVSQLSIYVDITVTETNEANVTFRLYNSTSQVNATTLTAGTRNVNWIGLADGEYNYNVTVTDLANNQNTTVTRTITLDVHAPNATLISPANNTYVNVSSQNFTANLSDNLGIQNSTLYIYNSTGLYNSTTTNFAEDITQTTLGIVVNLLDNVYTWFVNIFDWAGNNIQTANNTLIVDTVNPAMNITYPQNITYSTIITSMNYTIIEANPSSCWFYNTTANNTIACGTNITTKLYSTQGSNTWILYSNDSLGSINSSSVTFFVDSINPTINFTNPTDTNGSYFSRTNIVINTTASDANLANITINIYNSTALINSTTSLTSPNHQNISVPRDGIYYINATAYDSALNKNSTETRIITLDTTKPLVDYGAGTLASGVNVSQSNIYVNITVTETNEANVTFKLYNSTSQVNVTTLSAGTRSINWTGLSDKTYTYNVTVTDLVGNSNTTLTRTITLDVHAPNATLILPANGTYLNTSSQNFTANLSDNLGIQNSTLFIYNSSGLYNSTVTTFAADVTTTTLGIVVNLLDNVYTWFVNIFDWAGNQYATANETLTVDTTYPIVDFGTGTDTDDIISAQNNVYINVSVVETNEANITFNLYNSTSLINRTVFTTPVRTINFTNLTSSGVYSYNVTVADLSGNTNSTETRTITLAFIAPIISNLVYSPNLTDDIDPGANITFNATVVTDDFINISAVILEYYNGTAWTNLTMTNAGGDVYQANTTLIRTEANYTYFIFANDSIGNIRQTENSTIESVWDCSWHVSPTTLGATSGFNEQKNIGAILINNTGDAQFADNNCTLRFKLTYDLTEGRIYIDGSYFKFEKPYYISAKESTSINVNATFLTEIKSETAVITTEESYGISNLNSMNASATLVTVRGDQPYLFASIVSAPASILLQEQDFTLSAYLRNLAGDGSLSKSAYNVEFNWSLPSGFIVKEGDTSVNYPIILDNSANYNNLKIVLNPTNLPSLSPGTYTLYVYGHGVNSTGDEIIMINNESLVVESVNITLVCSNVSDSICVSACGYLLDSDCSAPSVSGSSSGGGGGGGGGASPKIEKSEATFELVRGKEQSFQLPIKNKYQTEMRNISISVSGLNAEYISIEPKTIPSLLGGASKNVSVKIKAPAYFTGRSYNLTFEIKSNLMINDTSNVIIEKKLVTLYILEMPRLEGENLLNSSLEMINEMNSSGMFIKNVNLLFDQLNKQYQSVDFFGVKSTYQKIKTIYDNAFESKSIISELNENIAEAEKNGITVTETKKMLYIGETAYARGDYALALERLKEAKLTYAAEAKGEFNLAYYIKNHPLKVLGIILSFIVLSLIIIFTARFVIYKKKLKMLKEEEILLLELMKVIQRECFEKNRMSMEEYEAAMNQYERKLGLVIEDGIRIGTKLSNMFKIRAIRNALDEEKKKLVLLIKKLQDDYLNKNKIETRVYENMLRSYTTKLSEVQEQIAFIDAGDALRKQKNFLRRLFRI